VVQAAGAGSVVRADVAPRTTVAGMPAVKVGRPQGSQPALDMNHDITQQDQDSMNGPEPRQA